MKKGVGVAIVGAGPAGLATSRELARRQIDHVLFERGDRLGHTWENLYDSLVLHTGKHLSALPGMPFPRSTPLFPRRDDFLAYLNRYATGFRLPIETRTDIVDIARDLDGWRLTTARGCRFGARVVVIATGIVSNPYVPVIPGAESFQGNLMHSVEYRRPAGFRSRRVLLVGAGNSAGEIAAELAGAGAEVTIAVRSGARTVPRQVLGIPIQYLAVAFRWLPREAQRRLAVAMSRASEAIRGPAPLPPPRAVRCAEIPLIGFHLVDAIRAGRVRLKRTLTAITTSGALFDDGAEEPFAHIILATGYRAAVGLLGTRIRTDECGFARRHDRVVSSDQPDLYFVGHNYDLRGGLRNIADDARLVATMIGLSRQGARDTCRT